MKYIDLHCDALTTEGVPCVTGESLRAGGCLLQCFAAFLRKGEGLPRFLALADAFDDLCRREDLHPVSAAGLREGKVNAVLTVEGGELPADPSALDELCARGVRMVTLTWNFENALGFPNGGRRERERGLTARGREAVLGLLERKIVPDVSHGSDRLADDVHELCKAKGVPYVASHSNAAAVCDVPRNLKDVQIRGIADCGGVVGLNFYAAFLFGRGAADADGRAAVLAHARHLLSVGGEDLPALGSDFDGAPPTPGLGGPRDVPPLLDLFERAFGARIAEKIAYKNALRVLTGK